MIRLDLPLIACVAAACFAVQCAAGVALADSAGDLPASVIPTSPNPDHFRFDSQCVTIDGKDMVLFSGAFHYFRCPRELWAQRLATLKAAGFNTLETYAAWNWHEPEPPADLNDFSKFQKLDELHDWLAMATDQFGFNVILRPGPYICAEWDGGGYPQWLLTRRPADFKGREWLRSDDPTYLAWCKHWYTAVAKVAAPFQITRRPAGKSGILFWQIENEYNFSDQPAEVKRGQLDYLAHASRDLGIEIPLITCVTENPVFRQDEYLRRNVIDCVNTYPKYDMHSMAKTIDVLDTYQPGLPKMITELQGGWFAQVGGKLSEAQGFDASQINQITLLAWEHGFTGTNYYMAFGGTNFGDWAARGLITSYDYDAPVREPGGVTARYLAVKALGQFIADHGSELARAVDERLADADAKPVDSDLHVAVRREAGGARFVFVRNTDRKNGRRGMISARLTGPDHDTITVNYDLPKFGAKVLYLSPGQTTGDDWYPKPFAEPQRPTDLPPAITITDAKTRIDPGPSQWTALAPGQSIEDAGIFNRGFVFYRATVPTNSSGGKTQLSFTLHDPDWAGVTVDGRVIAPDAYGAYMIDPAVAGKPLVALYENFGRPNFGTELEQRSGMLDAGFSAVTSEPVVLNDWREQHLPHNSDHDPATLKNIDDSSWAHADVTVEDGDLKPNEAAMYRTTITLSAEQAGSPMALSLGRVDDRGTVYVNDHRVGECNDWSHAQRFTINSGLVAGANTITVIVHNREGAGGLSHGAWMIPQGQALPTQWEISDKPAGIAEQWWNPALDESDWQSVHLSDTAGADPAANPPLLRWYRFNFSLPAADPHVWVPWKLHLAAVGNGFLYLNGHALGRWWQTGPQTEFYLPECWLNFGAGSQNVVAISLRPNGDAQLRSAEIAPYANLAETR